MNSYQEIINNLQESRNKAFFKEGMEFLITGASQSLVNMQECDLDSEEGQRKVFGLGEQLRTKINSLCSLHLSWLETMSTDHLSILTDQHIISKEIHAQNRNLESELRLEKRRNKRFKSANIRLKKRVKRMGGRLAQLKERTGVLQAMSGVKIKSTLEAQIQALKGDLEESQKKFAQSARMETKRSVDSLVARLQQSLNIAAQSIQQQSIELSTKIEGLSTNLTEKIGEVPEKVKVTLNLDELMQTQHQSNITPHFASIKADLEERQKQIKGFAKTAEEGIKQGFKSMIKRLQKLLTTSKSQKEQLSTIGKRIQRRCKDVVETIGQRSEALSSKVDEVAVGVKQLNQLLGSNPIYEELRDRVGDLYEAHQLVKAGQGITGMTISVETVKELKGDGFVGEDWTYLALKDESSFMIGTHHEGFKVVEKDNVLYSGKLPVGNVWLGDIIYVKPLNCYFIDHNDKLYRKDVDHHPPYLYMDVKCGYRVGASFIYSAINDRLIINKDWQNISAISLGTKTTEIEVEKNVGDFIRDFRLFGEEEDRVVSATEDGHIILYRLDYAEKSGEVVAHSKIELIKDREEQPRSLSVCDQNQYVFVEIRKNGDPYICSRMMVFKITEDYLIKKATIDQSNENIGYKIALECYGYVGAHILWIGLSGNENGVAQVYDYDTESGLFRELEEKRVGHQEEDPTKIHRLGDKFYYTGEEGKIMRLILSN